MSCTLINSGIPKSCDNNSGGIKNVYITDYSNVLSTTASGGEITAFSLASGTKFYDYEFLKYTSTFAEKGTISIENGTVFNEQTVTIKIAKRDKTKRANFLLLLHKNLAVIVLDMNGVAWYIGETNGANLSDLPSESGTNLGDANGYTLTIMGREPNPAQEVDPTIIPALIA